MSRHEWSVFLVFTSDTKLRFKYQHSRLRMYGKPMHCRCVCPQTPHACLSLSLSRVLFFETAGVQHEWTLRSRSFTSHAEPTAHETSRLTPTEHANDEGWYSHIYYRGEAARGRGFVFRSKTDHIVSLEHVKNKIKYLINSCL